MRDADRRGRRRRRTGTGRRLCRPVRRAALRRSLQEACQTGGHRREVRRRAVTDDIPHRGGVEVLRDEIAEQIELRGPFGGEGRAGCGPEPGAAGLLRDAGEQRAAEPVVLQQPVPVGAEDGARVGALTRRRRAAPDRPTARRARGGSRSRAPGAPQAVPGRRAAAPCPPRTRPPGRAAPGPSADAGLDSVRVRRSAARASGSRRRSRAPAARPARARRPRRPARVRAQPRRGRATVAFEPGSTTRSRRRPARRLGDVAHRDARLARQRVDVGGVGDPREPHHRHPQPLRAARRRRPADARRRRPRTASPRRRATARPPTAAPRASGGRSAPAAGRSPGASSAGSPRNLLTTNPATSAWSAGDSTATVPNRCASTPPRSMSPTTITGRSAACASPMFAMSVARRLISAGEPAPSQITTS